MVDAEHDRLSITDVLKEAGIRISMDGKGRWMDNVFIERLWRSLKYECVYLAEFATGSQARTGISWWMDFYNERRPHSALDDRTPQEAYTVNSTGRRNTSMMRCCNAETETEKVRPGGSACDAFAWSAAGNGACGAATVLEGDRAGAVE